MPTVCMSVCRLMHVRNANCLYDEAQSVWVESLHYVDKLKQLGIVVNKASLFAEYSTLLFARSQYEEVKYYIFLGLVTCLVLLHTITCRAMLILSNRSK